MGCPRFESFFDRRSRESHEIYSLLPANSPADPSYPLFCVEEAFFRRLRLSHEPNYCRFLSLFLPCTGQSLNHPLPDTSFAWLYPLSRRHLSPRRCFFVVVVLLFFSTALQYAKTQKNKATSQHLGLLKAKVAKLKR